MNKTIVKIVNVRTKIDNEGFWHHVCPDGQEYIWKPRVKSPKACPRCKQRLDTPYKPLDVVV